MKRNVDLTENRLFTNQLNRVLITITGKEIPWNVKSDDNVDDLDLYQIIVTGNKEARAKVRFYREMDSLDYCDCCGKRMSLKSWDREIGVCHQCNNHVFKDEDKCKWRNKERIGNAVIR